MLRVLVPDATLTVVDLLAPLFAPLEAPVEPDPDVVVEVDELGLVTADGVVVPDVVF